MRVIHLADLHLGFRAYTRVTKSAVNQREADVASTFARVVDLVIGRAPELVIVAGDVFHTVKPSNQAILHAYAQFSRLAAALPETVVVMVAGNHDTPRTSDVGSILPLFREIPNVFVADYAPQRFRFADRDLSVLAVPDAGHAHPDFAPDPSARYNVMVAHLEVAGVIARHAGAVAEAEIPLEALGVEHFQYVGVGHYHVHRQLAPNACYSGSIDYTSSNPWGELAEERAAKLRGKYVVECDLDTGVQHLHHVAPTRPLIDLPVIEAAGMSPRDLDDAIQANAASVSIDGAVVRQLVTEVGRGHSRELDHKALRALKARATHYHLVLRAESERTPERIAVRGERPSLEALLRGVLEKRAAEGQMDPEVLTRLGLGYLEQAGAMESERNREPAFDPATAADVAA